MANPKFYYYPTPDGTRLHTIDLGEPLAEMFSEFQVDSATAVGFDGSMYRTTGVHREIVTIQRDRFILGEDLAIKFQAMQNHLDRGYSVAFAVDADKAYCFPLSLLPTGGDHQIFAGGDPFRGFTGGHVPSAGDYITIESQNPALLFEQHKIESYSSSTPTATMSSSLGGTMNISPSVAFTRNSATFARHYRFYPVLKRLNSEVGRPIITSENGRLFTLNIRLVVDYQVLFSHHPDVGEYRTQEPTWGEEVPAFTGVRVFPEDSGYRINIDNSNPTFNFSGERTTEFSNAGNLIYPSRPDGLPK